MKKITLFVIAIIVSLTAFSQDKKLLQIEKLYSEKKYDKCIEKAEKYSENNRKVSDAFFYSGYSYYNKFLNSSEKNKVYFLKSAAKKIEQGKKNDKQAKNADKFKDIDKSLHISLKQAADSLQNIKKNSKLYYKYLVTLYNDTTDQYRDFYMPKNEKNLREEIRDLIKAGKINVIDDNGLKQGKWMKVHKSGKLAYEIHFKDNKPIGEYKRYHINGMLNVLMNYEENSDYTKAIIYDNKGIKIAVGFYDKKQKDSTWTYFENKKIIKTEIYKKGVLHGYQKAYFTAGNIYDEKFFVMGVENGTWKKFYKNGQLMMKATILQGKAEGTMIRYYKSGKFEVIGLYKNGLPEGDWKFYSEQGDIEIIKYIEGKPENFDKMEKSESDNYKKTLEMSKRLLDPNDFRDNPGEYQKKTENK